MSNNRPSPESGFSLMEVLFVLATIALIIGLSAGGLRMLSQKGEVDILIDAIQANIEAKRLRAMSIQQEQIFKISEILPEGILCSKNTAMYFRVNGTVSSTPFCISLENAEYAASIDWVTGQIEVAQ